MSTTTKTLAAALFAMFALGVFVSTGPWKTPSEVSFGVLSALGLVAPADDRDDRAGGAGSAPGASPLSASGTPGLQR